MNHETAQATEALRHVVEVVAECRETTLVEEIDRAPRLGEGDPLDDLAGLAHLVDAFDRIMVQAKEARAEAAEALARALPFGTSVASFDGLPAMTPRFPKDRSGWNSDALAHRVRREILSPAREVDQETGEIVEVYPTAQEVYSALTDVVSVTGSNVKVKGLKNLGIDPDEFCTATPGTPTVQIIRG